MSNVAMVQTASRLPGQTSLPTCPVPCALFKRSGEVKDGRFQAASHCASDALHLSRRAATQVVMQAVMQCKP